jgi:hypothetical protein
MSDVLGGPDEINVELIHHRESLQDTAHQGVGDLFECCSSLLIGVSSKHSK